MIFVDGYISRFHSSNLANQFCIFSLSLSSLGYSCGHQSDKSMGRSSWAQ